MAQKFTSHPLGNLNPHFWQKQIFLNGVRGEKLRGSDGGLMKLWIVVGGDTNYLAGKTLGTLSRVYLYVRFVCFLEVVLLYLTTIGETTGDWSENFEIEISFLISTFGFVSLLNMLPNQPSKNDLGYYSTTLFT